MCQSRSMCYYESWLQSAHLTFFLQDSHLLRMSSACFLNACWFSIIVSVLFEMHEWKRKQKENVLSPKVLRTCFLYADHDTAINRYSRLSKRRDNDKVMTLVTETLLILGFIIQYC